MPLKKTKACAVCNIDLSIILFVIGIAMLVTISIGIGFENDAFALFIGIVFFSMMLIALVSTVVISLIEGILVLSFIEKNKNTSVFVFVNGIIKFISFGIVGVLSVMLFFLTFWLIGLMGIISALMIFISAIFDMMSFSETKKHFKKPMQCT